MSSIVNNANKISLGVQTITGLFGLYGLTIPLAPKDAILKQVLVLEMIKSLLHVDNDAKRISRKQYNKELDDAVERIEKGNSISHKEALKEIAKW